jgi:hypothetical protein
VPYPVAPSDRSEFELALAALSTAVADYESAYRSQHGLNGYFADEDANNARLAASERARQAYDRLVAVTGSVVFAQQLRVACIFAASRVRGERQPNQQASPEQVTSAVGQAWEYSV